jgi:predicted esterase
LEFAQLAHRENKTPLLMCHGLDDGVVLYPWAKSSFDQLTKCGVAGEFKAYPDMAHGASEEEIDAVFHFIQKQLESS